MFASGYASIDDPAELRAHLILAKPVHATTLIQAVGEMSYQPSAAQRVRRAKLFALIMVGALAFTVPSAIAVASAGGPAISWSRHFLCLCDTQALFWLQIYSANGEYFHAASKGVCEVWTSERAMSS